MNRRGLVFACGLALVLVGWWLQTRSPTKLSPTSSAPPDIAIDQRNDPPEIVSDETAIGLGILKSYASDTQGLREDLDQLGELLASYLTLNKATDPLPLASNLDIAAAMRGANPFQMVLLPNQHAVFNEKGEIIDRFGNPIFFHALSQDQIEIRSAGPDGTMWTADDLQRQPNGTFRHPTTPNAERD